MLIKRLKQHIKNNDEDMYKIKICEQIKKKVVKLIKSNLKNKS